MPREFDVLLVHPVVTRRGRALHVIMPTGLFTLGSELQKDGFEVEIINLGVEKLLNADFKVQEYVGERNPKIVGIDLHWYPHSYVAIDVARQVKECSEALVVLGGYTASYFDMEILKNFPSIDVILRGEAELPLVELVRRYLSGEDFTRTPNSTVRGNSGIYRNPITYIPETIDDFSLNGLELLRHWEESLSVDLLRDKSPYAVLDSKSEKSIDLCVFRGCPYQCSYCGGGREAQKIICGREEPVLMGLKNILEEILYLKEKGVGNIRMEYVGQPGDEKFYLDLFREIRKEKIDISCRLSLWKTVRKKMLEAIKKSFNSVSIVLSPDSGSEKVRKLNKGPYYTNSQLYETIKILEAENMNADLYFTIGLPMETEADFKLTLGLATKLIRERKNVANVFSFGVTAEPCSPLHRTPEKYGIIIFRKSFLDFYDFWHEVENDRNVENLLGLARNDLSEAQIIERTRRFRSEIKKAIEDKGSVSST